MAKGIRLLENAITEDMMDDIMALQSSPLGFLTDKDSGQGYPVHIVKRVFIEATLNGARMVGNEVNIISQRMYLTKQYYQRVTREFPGVEAVAEQPGVPALGGGGALVPFIVTWQKAGEIFSVQCTQKKDKDGNIMDERIPVKVNSGMGADAILGKATRKALKRAYDRMLGFETPDSDPEANIVDEQRPIRSLSALTARLTGTELPPAASTNGNSHHDKDTGLEPGERVTETGEIVNSEVQPDAAKTEPAKTETPKEITTVKTAEEWQRMVDNAPTPGNVDRTLEKFVAAVDDANEQEAFRKVCETRKRFLRSQKTTNA